MFEVKDRHRHTVQGRVTFKNTDLRFGDCYPLILLYDCLGNRGFLRDRTTFPPIHGPLKVDSDTFG